jgi:hypothetical protein
VFRFLAIHMDEPARQRARELANTPEFAKARRERKKVEALFAQLKNQIGLRRVRLRRLPFVREQLPGGGGSKPQAIGAVPQPTDNTHGGSRLLAEFERKNGRRDHRSRKDIPIADFFNGQKYLQQHNRSWVAA